MGFVYLIKCNISGECYIGSSMCKNKKHRLSCHKGKYNECVSKQIIDKNDYQYIILEDILDIDKKQLRIKEQEYIDIYDCINKRKSYRTEEQEKQYKKQYNKTDKRKQYKKEYMKEYYFFNKYNDVIAQFINEINKY